MSLVEHIKLPAFTRLREQGHEVLSLDRAKHQDIRELHIGFLNMMPDAALEATERQYIRLLSNSNRIAQFYVYPFSLPALSRSQQSNDYINQYYCQFNDLKEQGLDALIITGANVANPKLELEPFWNPLMDVVSWAEKNVASILCSCLATHALLKQFHGIDRQPLAGKRWGVYSHRVAQPSHPLLRDINTRFDAPHSRYNDISVQQLKSSGLTVLAEGDSSGVHMAVSPDGFRVLYFQGHPEYDANSLLKEFKREVGRFQNGERESRPPLPENYFASTAEEVAIAYLDQVDVALRDGVTPPSFPESALMKNLDNTWGDTAKAIFNNWLGLIYQLTNIDRKKQYMDGVDPDKPLGNKI